MLWLTMLWLSTLWCVVTYLFFVLTLLACAVAWVIMAPVVECCRTRVLIGRSANTSVSTVLPRCFVGCFDTGTSTIWYQRYVITHYAHTCQKEDINVKYFKAVHCLVKVIVLWTATTERFTEIQVVPEVNTTLYDATDEKFAHDTHIHIYIYTFIHLYILTY